MAKNKKTVLKGFTYLQCDDFADYLSKMAAQGWHFKEWGAGLVFEKGEPENAVYAVEVFIHGSQYDLKPDEHTFNFADYCEEAGWKLIDARMKFCIFKQMRPDAVPIVTVEERLKNATKAYRGQLIWEVAIALLWIVNMLLRFLPKDQLINSLFSNFQLLTCAFWVYYAVCTAIKCIWYIAWICKAKRRMAAGETRLLNQAKETLLHWVSNCILVAMLLLQTAVGGPVSLLITIAAVMAVVIPAFLFAKLRPDRETFISFQVVLPIILVVSIVIVVIGSMPESDEEKPSIEQFPLSYSDLNFDAGSVASTYHNSSSSILGSKSYHSIRYKDASLSYEVYKSEQNWVLDQVWENNIWIEGIISGTVTDCSVLWDAETAFSNGRDYIVRYENAILILRFLKLELTEDHVAVIRDALELEG